MNGNWYAWGQQPDRLYRRVAPFPRHRRPGWRYERDVDLGPQPRRRPAIQLADVLPGRRVRRLDGARRLQQGREYGRRSRRLYKPSYDQLVGDLEQAHHHCADRRAEYGAGVKAAWIDGRAAHPAPARVSRRSARSSGSTGASSRPQRRDGKRRGRSSRPRPRRRRSTTPSAARTIARVARSRRCKRSRPSPRLDDRS